MATEYNASEIKAMSVDYVERMHDASQQSVSGVDLNREFLVLKLSKADLDTLINPTGCTGVFCLFGLDRDSQSVILVPHNANDKALPLDSSGIIKGLESWSPVSDDLEDIVFPNNPNNVQISLGVDNVLTNLGIL